MEQKNELIPAGSDLEQITTAIGALINPMATAQAEVQKHAINAETERMKISAATNEAQSKREFISEVIVLLIIAGVIIAAFTAAFLREQWPILTHLGTAALGALGGYGYARKRSP